MRSRSVLLALAFIGVPVAITACAENADESTSAGSDALSKKGEGAKCKFADPSSCKKGLVCGAEAQGKNGGPPPGAMGLPSPYGKCRKPAVGEKGGACTMAAPCNEGLVCVFPNGGDGHVQGMPPGAMGMPAIPKGTCDDAPDAPEDAGSAQSCPLDGTINCMPITDNPDCDSNRRSWIQDNCPDVSFLD